MTRRELLQGFTSLGLALHVPGLATILPAAKPIKLAVITDLHFGFAPDAMSRFDAFLKGIEEEGRVDAVLQLGDFCHPEPAAEPLLYKWRSLKLPRINVLGNHDMDKGTKEEIMGLWEMPSRYGVHDFGWLNLVVLDLNNLERQGKILPYEKGNYFQSGQRLNVMDSLQADLLEEILTTGSKPAVILSHQPLGFHTPGKGLPREQQEVFDILVRTRARNPRGAAALCISGHLHVDRAAIVKGFPCLSLNSASYHWQERMLPYRDPLFAFIELHPSGAVKVRGRQSVFVEPPPSVLVEGASACLSSRRLTLWKSGGIMQVQ